MASLLEDLDLAVEFADLGEWACGDVEHPRGRSHHTPEAPAEFLVVAPCCGDRGLLCRSRAAFLRHESPQIHCMKCDRRWSPEVYKFIPLPGVLPL